MKFRKKKGAKKQYAFNDLPGCVLQKKARITGTLVGVYNSTQAGLEEDPTCAWSTVCEVHGTLVGHASLKLAMDWSVDPQGWCQFCRAMDSRFILVDDAPEPFSLNDFLKNNEGLGEGDKEDILALEVGETLKLGGGAAAEFTLKRVA